MKVPAGNWIDPHFGVPVMIETSADPYGPRRGEPAAPLDAYAVPGIQIGKIDVGRQTGWLCPKCGRGVAPTEKTCGHGA